MQLSHAKPIEAYRGRNRSKRVVTLAVIAVLVIIGIIWGSSQLKAASRIKDSAASTQTVTIPQGLDTSGIAAQLLGDGLLVSTRAFTAAVILEGARGELQAGTYELSAAMSARDMVRILSAGKTKELKVTIPEGLRLDETAELIEKAGIVNSADFIAATKEEYDFSFLQSLPADADLEGFLFPDTYTFAPGVTARDVVTRMLGNFGTKINDLLPLIEESDLSLFEIVTLASIVEGEVPHEEDRPTVAGVFYNRLDADMLLQADSTLAYITKEDRIDFTISDTKIDDLYNTYLHEGLPPGPINSPSVSALRATLEPDSTDFLFFVSDPDTGETFFSETLEEHDKKVEEVLGD
jgi:UPF0755 protein